jgi:NAD(P) transhydrogenase
MERYDVLVIGSGPAGEKAAVQAAKLGRRVAVIEKDPQLGGVCLHTGTIPSKTLRETALFLADVSRRAPHGIRLALEKSVTLGELMHRKGEVIRNQVQVLHDKLARNDIETIHGEAAFLDEHTLAVRSGRGGERICGAEFIVIATGSRPMRPPDIPFDDVSIYDSDTILRLDALPRTLTIVGGGVIGCEYACIFAALGVRVTVVDRRDRLLRFVDREIAEMLAYRMRQMKVTLRLGEAVTRIELAGPGKVIAHCESGKELKSERLLHALGRVGQTEGLTLEAIGLKPNKAGLLEVNRYYQTEVPHVYAVGDVIGFPSLASTSMHQGRLAVAHAFGLESEAALPAFLPYGIYTIPEISMVGATEDELTEQKVPYEIGLAFYRESARGEIIGDVHGMLKLLFHRKTLELLGAHIIGDGASEIIHIGQAVLCFKGTVEYFVDNVFNYPTLSEAYKVAALNGLNRL